MIGHECESFSKFSKVLDSVLKYDEKELKDTSVVKLKNFINFNLRFIIQQTHNSTSAQDLQKKLLQFSDKINVTFNETGSELAAHTLAFEIMGIAQGIFSKEEDKIDFTHLFPLEIKQKIFVESIAIKADVISGLGALRLVSKKELVVEKIIKLAWINNENLSLKTAGCQSIKKAIHYMNNNHGLYTANLSGFGYFTDENLKELEDCTWIQYLTISSNNITDDGLKFIKKMPLKSVNFSWCRRLTDKAFEHLKEMKLQKVVFMGCDKLTDRALESLIGMPLESVNFRFCSLLTDKAVEQLMGMQLKSVDFSNCPLLTDKSVEYLIGMPLKKAYFGECPEIKDLKGFQQREKLCMLITDKSLEYLRAIPLNNIRLQQEVHQGFWEVVKPFFNSLGWNYFTSSG